MEAPAAAAERPCCRSRCRCCTMPFWQLHAPCPRHQSRFCILSANRRLLSHTPYTVFPPVPPHSLRPLLLPLLRAFSPLCPEIFPGRPLPLAPLPSEPPIHHERTANAAFTGGAGGAVWPACRRAAGWDWQALGYHSIARDSCCSKPDPWSRGAGAVAAVGGDGRRVAAEVDASSSASAVWQRQARAKGARGEGVRGGAG